MGEPVTFGGSNVAQHLPDGTTVAELLEAQIPGTVVGVTVGAGGTGTMWLRPQEGPYGVGCVVSDGLVTAIRFDVAS